MECKVRVIGDWRRCKGLTQEQLARKVGVSQAFISRLEGEETPTLETLRKIADALEVADEDLAAAVRGSATSAAAPSEAA